MEKSLLESLDNLEHMEREFLLDLKKNLIRTGDTRSSLKEKVQNFLAQSGMTQSRQNSFLELLDRIIDEEIQFVWGIRPTLKR